MVSTIERRDQTIIPDTAGGYLVPKEVIKRFWEIVIDDQLLRFITIYEQESGISNSIVIEDQQTLGVWGPEVSALTLQDVLFANISTPTMPKLTSATASSIEFLDDALADPTQGGRQILDVILANRLRRTLHQAIAVGTGTNQPTGLFEPTVGLTSVIGAISTVNLSSLFAAIHASHLSAPACAWLMSPATFKACIDLPLPNNWFSTAAAGRFMLSYPVILNAYAPANQIVFGNLAYYGIKRIPQIFAGVDSQSLALSGREIRFAWTRAEGKPVVSASSDVSLAILKPI